jgi:hypothetical protein
MALRINYNYQADFTHFNLRQTEQNMNKALERLATGYRINRAADDAAGLYIADQLKTYQRPPFPPLRASSRKRELRILCTQDNLPPTVQPGLHR